MCACCRLVRRDVMRGEEVQVFGALAENDRYDAPLCLPGTHNKWVRVEGGRLTDFVTAMTGEMYRVMCDHSILGPSFRKKRPTMSQLSRAMASGNPRGLLSLRIAGRRLVWNDTGRGTGVLSLGAADRS